MPWSALGNIPAQHELTRRDESLGREGAFLLDVLPARARQWDRRREFGDQAFGGECLVPIGDHRVERSHDRLLDLGSAEAVGGLDERPEVELGRILLPTLEVKAEDHLALIRGREIDKEDLVEAALS